ncbi:MAG TPA: PrpF domain-containing protein [Acetobacteraceae bacterium]|nr:PrpF domain-containing protein [Acetobacteraceae bacterium]
MTTLTLPAVFMRGGTSKAVIFHQRDLPARGEWDRLFLAAMGSPDPYGRQLNGMGGGISSLSKVCIIAPSARNDADVDYTFAQVQIREARVEYRANCGNMSAAIGPFSVDEGLVRAKGATATVRIYNTNTQKLIHAMFPLRDGRARYDGDLVIPGVAGSGAPVRLDFISPGGATTGKLLPTGKPVDMLDVPGVGKLAASMVDAANAGVFLRATDLGLIGTELPEQLDANTDLLARLQAIRQCAAVAMGIARDLDEARSIPGVPMIGFVAPSADAPTLTGESIAKADVDLTARFLSNGQPHRALPLTASLCTGVAARITGTLVADALAPGAQNRDAIRIGMPSGILAVGASVEQTGPGTWVAQRGSFFRTTRRLFDGRIYLEL